MIPSILLYYNNIEGKSSPNRLLFLQILHPKFHPIHLQIPTFLSQFVDTFTVLILLCSFGKIEWKLFSSLLLSGFLFKILVAALDTPFLYLAVYLFRKRFGLGIGEEIEYS